MESFTKEALIKLEDEGLLKDFSISVYKNNKKVSFFQEFENKKKFFIFSAGKPIIAAVIWKLHDMGELSFDDKISKFWPEFAKNNKDSITIKNVLTHTSGVSLTTDLPDSDYTELNRIYRWLENFKAESKPGQRIAYHEVTFGWILGEIIERITKKSFEESFIELVKIPLGIENIEFYTKDINNLPQEIINHNSSKLPTIPTIFKIFSINKLPLISGTCIARSEDLAKFYNEIINNKNWLSKSTKEEILKVHTRGLDYNDKMKFVKLGLGIRFDSDIFYEKETDYSDSSFGHTGMVSCIGWASIKKDIAVSICNNLLLSSDLNRYRLNLLSTAIKKDLNTIYV